MNTQAIVEEMYAIAINTTLDIRDTLTAMDKVLQKAISIAQAKALTDAADRAVVYCMTRTMVIPDQLRDAIIDYEQGE
jgi:hypothetical protein